MNLSSLQAEIGRLLGDPANDRWTAEVLRLRINQSQIEIQGFTSAVRTSESLTPVAGVATLSINASTMNIVRATKTLSDGTIKPFPGMTIEELEFLYPNYQNWDTGEPLYWTYDASLQQITMVPAPNADNAITNGITLWESRVPADLVNPTDIPFDSNNQMTPYHMAIVYRVVAQCFLDDGSEAALQKSRYYMTGNMTSPGLYEKQLGRITAEFDVPDAVPSHVLFRPAGGRIGGWGIPTKSNYLPWGIILVGINLFSRIFSWMT